MDWRDTLAACVMAAGACGPSVTASGETESDGSESTTASTTTTVGPTTITETEPTSDVTSGTDTTGDTTGTTGPIYECGNGVLEPGEDCDDGNDIDDDVCSNGCVVSETIAWIETYDNPSSTNDRGYGVATDGDGNIVVVGHESRYDLGHKLNIWVRKYDPDGTELWTDTHDGPAGEDDCGWGVATDTAGNVIVTGYEFVVGSSENVWVRKYDPDGTELWTQTYDGLGGGDDEGTSVATDSDDNIVVAGFEWRDDVDQYYDVWVRKYDSDGNELWTQTHNSPTNSHDKANGVAIDADGNVIVAGEIDNTALGTGYDVWVRKYDPDGGELWTATHDGIANGNDRAHDVTVDAGGNIVVVGAEHRTDLGQGLNIWMRKYDADGVELWTETYDSPAHASDYGRGVATDSDDNVVVIGYEVRSDLGQAENMWLRKHDPSGTELWTATYDNPGHTEDWGNGVAIDPDGNVVAAGYSYRLDLDEGSNIWVRKYFP